MLTVVQARMSSKRLPGKVLAPLSGKPMLSWTAGRLKAACMVSHLVVATSIEASDDPVAKFCDSEQIACYRGALNNVAQRFTELAIREGADALVRISGDSPVIDPEIVDTAIGVFRNDDCDLVTNVAERTFPKGQSVEVIRTSSLLHACDAMTEADREHVTSFFYTHRDIYRIVNFRSGEAAGTVQLSVDTAEDFAIMEKLLVACNGRPGNWRQLWDMQRALVEGPTS